ncbi:MAG TPA: PDZ domain-containing protein, partial [Fibrella sp.]
RPNENSANSTVSYYSKGAVMGSLLNLAILAGSNGERSMDDLMRLLYTQYYKKLKRGFTDEEFRKAAEQVAGMSLASFFEKGINGTGPLDYTTYFEPVGMRLVNVNTKQQDGFLGASAGTNPTNGRQTITAVRRGGAAEIGGLSVGDEVLAIDSVRLTDDLSRAVAGRKVGDRLRLIVNRGGQVRELAVQLIESPLLSYRLEAIPNASDKQKALYNKWLYIKQ